MPRTPIQNKVIKDERKLSLIEAALPLFATKGKCGVSIDEISKAANCSHGLVYHYFSSAENCFDEILTFEAFEKWNDLLYKDEDGSNLVAQGIIKELLNVSKKDLIKVSFFKVLIDDDNKNLFDHLLKLTNNKAAIETLFTLLRGIYLPLLIEKHPNVKVPSLESVIKLFIAE